ncbi:hypothetical protein EcWSU1_04535 [Enterobacter ludwigii]|uniref:Uncharacterized protein n=1 Tax=Enterobacter ludwigii TaxID=299767 RepID=G8LMP3_9ENTR|nr:hypothetical protein EcWSU1_04535 [Enterobacter ludwigii]
MTHFLIRRRDLPRRKNLTVFLLRENDARQNVQQQYAKGNDQHPGPGQLLPFREWAHRKFKNRHRQVGDRLHHVRTPELVGEGSKQQRRRFACNTGNGQQDTGHDPRYGGFQRNRGDHFPLRRAQRVSRFTQAIRHQFQHVLGGTNDDRYLQQRQRNHAGPAGEVFHLRHHNGVNKQTDHDRRRRQQDVVNETNHLCQPGFTPVLRQINPRHNAKRCTNYRRPEDQQTAARQGIRQAAARRIWRRRHLGEQRQRHPVDAAHNGREQDPDQPEQTERHRCH